MNFKIVKKSDRIYLAEFDSLYEMGMAFVRMQEYYESPEFSGKYFTLEDFIDYWANNNGNGSFDYPKKWHGYNLPGLVLRNWINDFGFEESMNDIREKEKLLINRIKMVTNRSHVNIEDCYFIGSWKGNKNKKIVINHEIAHAFYLLYPEYRNSCLDLFKKVKPHRSRIALAKAELLNMGYCEEVLLDEVQAYWSSSNHIGILGVDYIFKDNFDRFSEKIKYKKEHYERDGFKK